MVTAPGGTAITYDPAGRIYSLTQGSAVTRFEHLGPQMIIERNSSGAILRRYSSVEEIQRRCCISASVLARIGKAGAFGEIAASRRKGLWDTKDLGTTPLPLFKAADERAGKISHEAIEPEPALATMPEGQEVVEDYRTMGLSLRAHPLAFLRDELD